MQRLKNIIAAIIVIGIFLYLGHEIESHWPQIGTVDWRSNWVVLLVHLLAMSLMQIFMLIGWGRILQKHHIKMSREQLFYSFFVPTLGKYLPGKVLFLAGRIELVKRFGGSRRLGFSAFLLENIFHLLASAFLVIPSLIDIFQLPSNWQIVAYCLLCLTVIIIMAKPAILFEYVNVFLKVLRRTTLTIHISSKDSLIILLNYLMIWLTYGFGCAYLALEISGASYEYFLIVASAFVAAWMAGFLSVITPGGLGVREAAIVVLLQPVLGVAYAALLAVVLRITWTVVEMSFSAYALTGGKILKNDADSP